MSKDQPRKRQPEVVRQNLVDGAARLAAEQGPAAVTVQAVAQAAGVTKGGLFHHFPTKEALLVGMFTDLLRQLDAQLDAAIAEDPEPYGSFTRAYVDSALQQGDQGFASEWRALTVSMMYDAGLHTMWSDWRRARLERHKETDSNPMHEIVRLAADGVWLELVQDERHSLMVATSLQKRLHRLTTPEATHAVDAVTS